VDVLVVPVVVPEVVFVVPGVVVVLPVFVVPSVGVVVVGGVVVGGALRSSLTACPRLLPSTVIAVCNSLKSTPWFLDALSAAMNCP